MNIRSTVQGLILCDGKIFVHEIKKHKEEGFIYRCPGGGIDFGEKSECAFLREMKEEFEAEMVKVKYIGNIENIFTYREKMGHENIAFYSAKFSEKKMLDFEKKYNVIDSENSYCVWKDLSHFTTGKDIIVPPDLLLSLRKLV